MKDEIGIHDGVVEVQCEGWPVPKVFVIRTLERGDHVSLKVKDATEEYLRLFQDYPRFAYVSKLPSGVENGVEVDGVMLFQAEWMPPRTVAVGWVAPPPTPPQMHSTRYAVSTFGEGRSRSDMKCLRGVLIGLVLVIPFWVIVVYFLSK